MAGPGWSCQWQETRTSGHKPLAVIAATSEKLSIIKVRACLCVFIRSYYWQISKSHVHTWPKYGAVSRCQTQSIGHTKGAYRDSGLGPGALRTHLPKSQLLYRL